MEWSSIPVTKEVKQKFIKGLLSCQEKRGRKMSASDYIAVLLEGEKCQR